MAKLTVTTYPDGEVREYPLRDSADDAERERLREAVIEAARALDAKFLWAGSFMGTESAKAYDAFKRKMRELNEFESKTEL